MSESGDRMLAAVVGLLVDEGFEGVSVRKVAARAGTSIGAVQHHFPTKDAMLVAAMDQMSREFQTRLEARIPPDASAADALRLLMVELCGADPADHSANVVWLLRLARAAVDPATARAHAHDWGELETLIAELIRAARLDRDAPWAKDQAASLLALVDGIAMSVLVEPARMPPGRARTLAGQATERVLVD